MKKFIFILCTLFLLPIFPSCSKREPEKALLYSQTAPIPADGADSQRFGAATELSSATEPEASRQIPEPAEAKNGSEKEESVDQMYIQIGEQLLCASLEQNSSAKALAELLSSGPVTITLQDYAHMEKVGTLPVSLPQNNEQINPEAGDLILYQGNSFVIYYDVNSWSLTRLGKIQNITQQELKELLGDGEVTAVLSLLPN